MKKRVLGKDLEVSAVGLGCMGFTHAYGLPADKEESKRAIAEAVDYGYAFFDTAECYVEKNAAGELERNEDLVGEALKPYRDRVKLASKFGVTITDRGLVTDSRPETIRKAIDGSLKRLQTDHLDLYYQHRIDENMSAEEVAGAARAITGTICRSIPMRATMPIRSCCHLSGLWQRRMKIHRRRFLLRECSARSPISYQFQVPER